MTLKLSRALQSDRAAQAPQVQRLPQGTVPEAVRALVRPRFTGVIEEDLRSGQWRSEVFSWFT